jgi:hypothetical protein
MVKVTALFMAAWMLTTPAIGAETYTYDQQVMDKVRGMVKQAMRSGVSASNFDGLRYGYIMEDGTLKYGYRQFCYDLAWYECSQKTYPTVALQNCFKMYLNKLLEEHYLDWYGFDTPYWSDGMNGVSLWLIRMRPGWQAMQDFELGNKAVEKYLKGSTNSSSSWQGDDNEDLKTWIANQQKRQEEEDRRQKEYEAEIQRQADAFNAQVAESQTRLKQEEEATKKKELELEKYTSDDKSSNGNQSGLDFSK